MKIASQNNEKKSIEKSPIRIGHSKSELQKIPPSFAFNTKKKNFAKKNISEYSSSSSEE